MNLIKEFKDFALKRNVIDTAVGVVIGVVFGNLVNSVVTDIFIPLLGLILNEVDFHHRIFKLAVGNSCLVEIRYGAFITALINFLIVSWVVFFIMKLMVRFNLSRMEKVIPQRDCPECQMSIPLKAKKCGHCGSIITEKILE